MKEKKPFKIGATYKLDERLMHDYRFTTRSIKQCEKYYGQSRAAFTMRVIELFGEGGCRGVMQESDGSDTPFLVIKCERKLFTRVDNK